MLDRLVTSPAGATPGAHPLKPCFPERFQGVLPHGLNASINDGGNAQRSCALSLGKIDPPNRRHRVEIELTALLAQRRALVWGLYQEFVYTWCVLAMVHLGDATNTLEEVRPAPPHQPLPRPDLLQIAASRSPQDPL